MSGTNNEKSTVDSYAEFGKAVEGVRMLIRAERPEDAKARLAPLLADEPDNGGLWHLMATAHLLTGEYAAGAEAARNAIAANPDSATPHGLLAQIYEQWGAFQDALTSAETALECDPHYANAHLMIAQVLGQADEDFERARHHAEKARELDPEDDETHFTLGSLLAHRGNGKDIERGRASLRTAIQLEPDEAIYWHALGLASVRRRNWADALRNFITSAQLNPQLEYLTINLPSAVWALVLRGRTWLTGLLFLATMTAFEASDSAAEITTGRVVAHLIGALVIAALSWWMLVTRLLRPFPRSMRIAAGAILRRDQLVLPTRLGLAIAAVLTTIMVAVPWGNPAIVLGCAGAAMLIGETGTTVSRVRARRMNQEMRWERERRWANVVRG